MMNHPAESQMARMAEALVRARHAWALTGAGVSTESGIPDFRSPQSGLWAQYNPLEVASIQGFLEDPARFYAFWRQRFARLSQASPNVTHRVLAEWEAQGRLQGVITQNIDGLHLKAGSQTVYEVHGSYRRGRCLGCGRTCDIRVLLEGVQAETETDTEAEAKAKAEGVPRCDRCGGLLKPDVVLFGELLPEAFYESLAAVQRCDLLLVLGTSLEVYPVADLVPQAKRAGATLIILNREPTPMDGLADVVIHAQLGPVMERLKALVGGRGPRRADPSG